MPEPTNWIRVSGLLDPRFLGQPSEQQLAVCWECHLYGVEQTRDGESTGVVHLGLVCEGGPDDVDVDPGAFTTCQLVSNENHDNGPTNYRLIVKDESGQIHYVYEFRFDHTANPGDVGATLPIGHSSLYAPIGSPPVAPDPHKITEHGDVDPTGMAANKAFVLGPDGQTHIYADLAGGAPHSLGSHTNVDASADTAPVGKVLGTTATGQYGPIDPPAGGVTDHGALDAPSLLDDDHPQYHTDARGDARYYTQATVDSKDAAAQAAAEATAAAALAAHEAAPDPHTGYLTQAEGDAAYDAVGSAAAAQSAAEATAAAALTAHHDPGSADHDDRYYTEAEVDAALGLKADSSALAAHTGDASIHYADAPSDGTSYARKDGAWVPEQVAGSASWGTIGGTLSDQTDLQNALNAKADDADLTAHETATTSVHGIADTAALETQAGAQTKANTAQSAAEATAAAALTAHHDAASADHDDRYYTEAEVDAALGLKADQSALTAHTGNAGIHYADAPSDGSQYARKDGAWEVVIVSGGGGTYQGEYDAATNSPNYPSGVGLVAGDWFQINPGGTLGTVAFNTGDRLEAAIDTPTNTDADWIRIPAVSDHQTLTNRSAAGAHPATAVSFDNAASGLAATNVKAAIDEVDATVDSHGTGSAHDATARSAAATADAKAVTAQTTADNHIANATGAHAASAVSVTAGNPVDATDVEAALSELHGDAATATSDAAAAQADATQALTNAATAQSTADNHIAAATGAHAASAVSVTAGNPVTATDVESAISELHGLAVAQPAENVDTKTGSSYTAVAADNGKVLRFTGSGTATLNLPAPGTVGAGWRVSVRNERTGQLTIVPASGQIDGQANRTSRPSGGSFKIHTDGANYYTVGRYLSASTANLGVIRTATGPTVDAGAATDEAITPAAWAASSAKSKLDGIEAGATADQTPAEIKTAYESNANTNAFTDAEQSKLGGIEAGATADQTGAEIKALYEAEPNTNAYTDAEQTKVGHLSVTQAVDLDAIESRVNDLDAAVVLRGTFAPSGGVFPGSGTAQAGDSWIATDAGTIDGVAISADDRLIAILDNASTTTYAGNWHKADYTDLVQSVDGRTGAVTLGDLYATTTQGAKADTALQSVVAGTDITVDNTDPLNPIINSTAAGGGGITIHKVAASGADFTTLADAQTAASEGDIILLKKGESFAPTAIWRSRITIGAYSDAAAGEAMPIITDELAVTGNEVTIQDIYFKDFTERGIAGTNAQQLRVSRCWFSGGTSVTRVKAIGLNNCNHSIIEDCKIFDIAPHKYTDRDGQNFAAVTFFYTDDCIFRRNEVAPGGPGVFGNLPGINVREGKRTIIEDNDFHDCMSGVVLFGSAGSVVRRNHIHDGSGSGITVGSMSLLGGEPVDPKSGTYDASTNTPDLESGTGIAQYDWYEVTVAGTFNPTGGGSQEVAVGTLLQANVATPTQLSQWSVFEPSHDITISDNHIENLLRGLGTWNGIDVFVVSDRMRVEGNTVRGVNKHCLAFDHFGPKVADQSSDDVRWYSNTLDARTNTPQEETLVKYNVSGTGYQGLWDASSGTFPQLNLVGGALVINNNFVVSVPGTVDGIDFEYGDQINANVNNPSATDSTDWAHHPGGDALPFAFTMAPSATNPAIIQFFADLNTYYPNENFQTGDIIGKHGRYTDGFTYYTLAGWQAHCRTAHDNQEGRSVLGDIATAGAGSGDMLKSIYDPVNGNRQVSFADELSTHAASTALHVPSTNKAPGRRVVYDENLNAVAANNLTDRVGAALTVADSWAPFNNRITTLNALVTIQAGLTAEQISILAGANCTIAGDVGVTITAPGGSDVNPTALTGGSQVVLQRVSANNYVLINPGANGVTTTITYLTPLGAGIDDAAQIDAALEGGGLVIMEGDFEIHGAGAGVHPVNATLNNDVEVQCRPGTTITAINGASGRVDGDLFRIQFNAAGLSFIWHGGLINTRDGMFIDGTIFEGTIGTKTYTVHASYKGTSTTSETFRFQTVGNDPAKAAECTVRLEQVRIEAADHWDLYTTAGNSVGGGGVYSYVPDTIIDDCDFEGLRESAIYLAGQASGSSYPGRMMAIRNCRFWSCMSGPAIKTGLDEVLIESNHFDNTVRCVTIEESAQGADDRQAHLIAHNTFRGCARILETRGGRGVRFVDNEVMLHGAKEANGTTFVGFGLGGVYCFDLSGEGGVISDNTFDGFQAGATQGGYIFLRLKFNQEQATAYYPRYNVIKDNTFLDFGAQLGGELDAAVDPGLPLRNQWGPQARVENSLGATGWFERRPGSQSVDLSGRDRPKGPLFLATTERTQGIPGSKGTLYFRDTSQFDANVLYWAPIYFEPGPAYYDIEEIRVTGPKTATPGWSCDYAIFRPSSTSLTNIENLDVETPAMDTHTFATDAATVVNSWVPTGVYVPGVYYVLWKPNANYTPRAAATDVVTAIAMGTGASSSFNGIWSWKVSGGTITTPTKPDARDAGNIGGFLHMLYPMSFAYKAHEAF